MATVAPLDVGRNRITVSSNIATDSPVMVFLNGQLVETANLVAGNPTQLDLPDLPLEAFSQSIQVFYFA